MCIIKYNTHTDRHTHTPPHPQTPKQTPKQTQTIIKKFYII